MPDCSSRFSILTSLCCFSLPQPALHTQLGAVRNRVGQPHLESQHYTIPVCLLLFARQDTHPVFLFYFYPPVAHSRFSCFSRIWDFSFYSEDPVPVGFEPVRRLRPQPIPFPVGQKFTTGTVLSRVALVTRQRLCTGTDIPSACSLGYFQSEC